MSRDRRRIPGLESLEGKQLLSTVHGHAPAPRPPAVVPGGLPLDGSLTTSTHTTTLTSPESEKIDFPFSGRAGSMGPVQATLTEQVNESVEAVSGGNVVLKNARGSVTLTFSKVNVLENLTVSYNSEFLADYQITSATGAYAGSTGHGSLEVTTDVADPVIHLALATAKP